MALGPWRVHSLLKPMTHALPHHAYLAPTWRCLWLQAIGLSMNLRVSWPSKPAAEAQEHVWSYELDVLLTHVHAWSFPHADCSVKYW